jgi:hypothetical protein
VLDERDAGKIVGHRQAGEIQHGGKQIDDSSRPASPHAAWETPGGED